MKQGASTRRVALPDGTTRAVTSTDNARLPLKLALRRKVIDRADLGALHVLDLCAGTGAIWRAMRKSHEVLTYTPLDRDPRMPGTIKVANSLDPNFLRAFSMGRFNVVDVDTYGEPWGAWLTIAPLLAHRTAIFLTHGTTALSRHIATLTRLAIGLPAEWEIPGKRELIDFAGPYILADSARLANIEAAYRASLPNVTYYGLVVSPK